MDQCSLSAPAVPDEVEEDGDKRADDGERDEAEEDEDDDAPGRLQPPVPLHLDETLVDRNYLYGHHTVHITCWPSRTTRARVWNYAKLGS